MNYNQSNVGSFISNYNFRPLLLTFQEVQAMKNALGDDEGSLFICPVFANSSGIDEQIVTLRFFLYKKQETIYTPINFDFKPTLGSVQLYEDKIKNASLPCFEIPWSLPEEENTIIPQKPTLSSIFATLELIDIETQSLEFENYFYSFFLQKDSDESISLQYIILRIKIGGGGGPGGDCPVTSGPPPKPQG